MTREHICGYVGFETVPVGIELFFADHEFEWWVPTRGPDREGRAKWRYVDVGDGKRKATAGRVYGIYQQAPDIQDGFVPKDIGPFAAVIKLEADTGFVPGLRDKEVLQAKIEQTLDALLSKYTSVGATRYSHENVLRRSTA